MTMIGKTAGIVAAAAALFIGGFVAGNRNVEATKVPEPVVAETAAEDENQYMLLMFMRGEDRSDAPRTERPADDTVYRAIVDEYRDWAMDRAAEGRLVSAHKLASDTRVMTASAGRLAVESSAHTDRVLGGYFLITAGSLEEAIELAKSHPHLKYGGEVEVRPIEVTRR
jgi:hypothetical protein